MIGAIRRAYAGFRGFDTADNAVPAMDGPLTPNTRLDEARLVARLPGIDNLVATPNGLLASQGGDIVVVQAAGGTASLRIGRSLGKPISCLAAGPDGVLAAGLDGQGILIIGGRHDGKMVTEAAGHRLICPTAAVFADADTVIVTNGSATHPAAQWKHDLMAGGASGSLHRLSLSDGKAKPLALGLAYPTGLALSPEGELFLSEAWHHRLLRVSAIEAGVPSLALGQLPAYPGRVVRRAAGGFWLALFAPRNQLVEFVLSEPEYRRRMIETIDPDLWVAPALASGLTYLEPIQGGARKKLNQLKPWSPSWSYGLVLRCDDRMRPVDSYHSRADGRVHGVTSLAEWNGELMVGAKGDGVIVGLTAGKTEAQHDQGS
ncbi:SMP-30/gluconolactonase/LRE family protein [Acidisoma silvae]|uniref:Strictosidine synthase conserved region domain-containing protein n=1 Tax=Acidisoma silvae TaxID=2802396 RepID=A0A964E1H1_9PROT|nr:hypothetical protein [Acidisoma silvae]MCB8878356.1 hypothetical protein [Acidisoma silvae]